MSSMYFEIGILTHWHSEKYVHCKFLPHENYREWELRGPCRLNLQFLWKRAVRITKKTICIDKWKWKRKCIFKNFTNEKFKKIFYLSICMLPDYMAHDITKFFWKKKAFWKYDSCFCFDVSKFTSVNYL